MDMMQPTVKKVHRSDSGNLVMTLIRWQNKFLIMSKLFKFSNLKNSCL